MSGQDRKKKDGQRTDKKNQARREAENPRTEGAQPPQQGRDTSNFTDQEVGPADANREGRGGR